MRELSSQNRASRIIVIIVLSLLLFIILMPLWWAVTLSFDGNAITSLAGFSWLPEEFSFKNYKYAYQMIDIVRYYANTLFVTVTNTVISVFFALMCGYAFAKGKFFGKTFWYFFMLAVMMVPFESRMIPLYIQYNDWGMIDTYWPLILGNVAYVYGIFFASQSIAALPDSLRESAFLDGAGEWKVFLRIILPLCKPIMAALSILQIVAQWNSYLWPMITIRSVQKQLISVGVALFNAQENTIYYGPRMAIAVLSAFPLVIAFLFLQKYIVQSIALSGIKQ